MDLLNYDFAKGAEAKATDSALLNEAKAQGFYKSYCRWDNLANQLMLGGGSISLKPDLRSKQRVAFIAYIGTHMSSFTADHADKVAVCAMLLKEFSVHPADISSAGIPNFTQGK